MSTPPVSSNDAPLGGVAAPDRRFVSLDEVRAAIDTIDRQIVRLLAERGQCVKEAARFKKTTDEVKAPARVEQVIAKVTALAHESGANPAVIEKVYRTMIAAFVEAELAEHARTKA